jgi:hypothetical protein
MGGLLHGLIITLAGEVEKGGLVEMRRPQTIYYTGGRGGEGRIGGNEKTYGVTLAGEVEKGGLVEMRRMSKRWKGSNLSGITSSKRVEM